MKTFEDLKIGDKICFVDFDVTKEDAIEELKIWVEEAKQNLYETNKLLVKVKELK